MVNPKFSDDFIENNTSVASGKNNLKSKYNVFVDVILENEKTKGFFKKGGGIKEW